MKKIMTSNQYVKDGGGRCPVCKSKNIISDCFDMDGSQVWSRVDCNDCGANWKDVYKLTGYDDLIKGE